MGEFEAVGDVVTGALAGRAVEPTAGEPSVNGHTAEKNCLNCGAALAGEFCHACGQQAHVHRTLTAFFHDFLHGVLHFEGKIWRTLPLLAWKPGELTRRYIDGERARFLSPIALFLFSVFLTYAVFQLAGISAPSDINPAVSTIASDDPAQVRKQLDELKKTRAQLAADNPAAPILDTQIAAMDKELGIKQAKADKGKVVLAESADRRSKITGQYTGITFLDHGVDEWRENPGLMAYKLKTNAYKFSWMIIPLSVPFVWLLFPFSRRFRLYDHTVFVTYSLCFMSLLVVIGLVLGALGFTTLSGLLWLLPPFHMYRQLRGTYALGRGGAIWRTALLTIFAILAISLFSATLLGIGSLE